jgi:hypothetical protein
LLESIRLHQQRRLGVRKRTAEDASLDGGDDEEEEE